MPDASENKQPSGASAAGDSAGAAGAGAGAADAASAKAERVFSGIKSLGIELEGGAYSVVFPYGRVPLGPLWLLALTVLLVPVALLGLAVWGAGAFVAWHFKSKGAGEPVDAKIIRTIGKVILKVYWLPHTLFKGLGGHK